MTEKTRRVISAIAEKEGGSPERVESEMRKAIRLAMTTDDPKARALWRQIAPDGKEPELDVFFEFVVNNIYLQ